MENLLDSYFLEGHPGKAEVIEALLRTRPVPTVAGKYLEGFRLLGQRTPDLALAALRLELAGKPAVDAGVVKLRDLSERARNGDAQAIVAYRLALG